MPFDEPLSEDFPSFKRGLRRLNNPNMSADLGDDDLFDPAVVSGYITDLAKGSAYHALADADPVDDTANDPDHREDGLFDELDDVEGWVTETGNAQNAALNKHAHQNLDRLVAGKTVANHERAVARRRENQAKDKSDRATCELVLDPRTRMILFRLLSRGRLRTLDGCVSTGKEANVYYGTAAANSAGIFSARSSLIPKAGLLPEDRSPDAPVAVKVYKTSILSFKDRERYVSGEFRFRRGGYNKSSNRKMVQQWAEKEYRNLTRLQEADIPCPVPLFLKAPVLVMSFFGRDGWPAPLLKDASLSGSRLERAYFRVCVLMRRMFHVARLVHGDLSEYNMLFWKGEVIIIDVSQSVEHDHPMALDFLRRDCSNVNDFFQKNGVPVVLGLRELFDYITATGMGISESDCAEDLRSLLDNFAAQDDKSRQDDKVFMHSYIPRSLHDVTHPTAIDAVVRDGTDSVLFGKLKRLSISQNNDIGSRDTPQSIEIAISSQGDASSERNNTPRPNQLIGFIEDSKILADDGENNLGFPNLDFEEDNFDECNEPIATKLPSIATKSSKSSSERASPAQLRILARNTSTEALTDPSGTPVSREREYGKYSTGRRVSSAVMENGIQNLISPEQKPLVASILRSKYLDRVPSTAKPAEEAIDGDASESSNFDELDESTFEWTQAEPEPQEYQDDGEAEAQNTLEGLTKKERKKHVKAEARERRESKTPKHVKKRKEAQAKRRRGVKVKK